MIGKWFLPLPFIFANKNYTLTKTLILYISKQKKKSIENFSFSILFYILRYAVYLA